MPPASSKAGIISDPEISQAFKDLQAKLNQTKHDLEMCNALIHSKSKDIDVWNKLVTDISGRPEDEDIYEVVGRVFVKGSKDKMLECCHTSKQEVQNIITKADQQRENIQKGYDTSKQRLKEMIERKHQSNSNQ
ncbi:hypothetical protein GJ496_003471 [Pomphorhynchus laevis]|nr:hypothetical protein GJ496_003471 [Pomphorhynchus laevis]